MTKALRNPGHESPKILEFDSLPALGEFFREGGVPGVEYLYLMPQEQPKAQREGWSTIVGMPFFSVRGTAMTAMARGKPINGAGPGTSICKLQLSTAAKKLITQSVEVPGELSETTPKLPPAEAALEAAVQRARSNKPVEQPTVK